MLGSCLAQHGDENGRMKKGSQWSNRMHAVTCNHHWLSLVNNIALAYPGKCVLSVVDKVPTSNKNNVDIVVCPFGKLMLAPVIYDQFSWERKNWTGRLTQPSGYAHSAHTLSVEIQSYLKVDFKHNKVKTRRRPSNSGWLPRI